MLTLASFSLMLTVIFVSTFHNVDPHHSKLPRRHKLPQDLHTATGVGAGGLHKVLIELCWGGKGLSLGMGRIEVPCRGGKIELLEHRFLEVLVGGCGFLAVWLSFHWEILIWV